MIRRKKPARAASPQRGRAPARPELPAAREAVAARARGICELCCERPGTDAHHRQTRRFGADCPCNLLWLCSACHHAGVHAKPQEARESGWIVSRHATAGHQAHMPVLLRGVFRLTLCDGTLAMAPYAPH